MTAAQTLGSDLRQCLQTTVRHSLAKKKIARSEDLLLYYIILLQNKGLVYMNTKRLILVGYLPCVTLMTEVQNSYRLNKQTKHK